jgi:DNA excision repair protein ERCC-2
VQEKLCLLVCNQINTRWAMREQSLEPIARLLFEMVSAKAGNYIAYFPSYQYLQKEAEVFSQLYPQLPLVLQSPQEDDFLAQFDQPHPERSLLGFAVLGGIYSEGVDLQGEKLLGCAIIGTGLPKVGAQQEILREYFQQKNNSGYDFAYRFPGMNKVLQAAGRVIRSPQDRGVVLLLASPPQPTNGCSLPTGATHASFRTANSFGKRSVPSGRAKRITTVELFIDNNCIVHK